MFTERAAYSYPHESLCTLIIWQFRVTVVMIQFQLDARNIYIVPMKKRAKVSPNNNSHNKWLRAANLCIFIFFQVSQTKINTNQHFVMNSVSFLFLFNRRFFLLSFFFRFPFISSHIYSVDVFGNLHAFWFHPGEKIKASIKIAAEEMFSTFGGGEVKLSTIYIFEEALLFYWINGVISIVPNPFFWESEFFSYGAMRTTESSAAHEARSCVN